MSHERIKVFLRIRKDGRRKGEGASYEIDETNFEYNLIRFHVDRSVAADFSVNHSIEDYTYKFTRVMAPTWEQDQVFDVVARQGVLNALDGYHSTVLAYGQTGSGKTYTITGGTESYSDRGIIPRSLAFAFEETKKRPEYTWSLCVSYLQIYNDKPQDLLNNGKDANSLEDLPAVTIREADDEVVLKGLQRHPVTSVTESLGLLFLGDTNRIYCETPLNKTSSRSHCIFMINVEGHHSTNGTVRRATLYLVDLAGSERVSKTGVSGNVLSEAKYINLSLHYLEHVIVALTEQAHGTRDHIPYRNSTMTMVLKTSLEGNCRTVMVATAHPGKEYLLETMSTCRFAQRVACIKQDARVNEEVDPMLLIRKLRREVAQLKEQLAFYEKGGTGLDRQLDCDELARCRAIVRAFVADSDPTANLVGVDGDAARLFACVRILKEQVLNRDGDAKGATSGPLTSGPTTTGIQGGSEADEKKRQHEALTASLKQRENELSMLFSILEQTHAAKFNASTQTGSSPLEKEVVAYPAPQLLTGLGETAEATARQHAHALDIGGQESEMTKTMPSVAEESYPDTPEAVAIRLAQGEGAAIQGAHVMTALKDRYDLSQLEDDEALLDRASAFEAFRRSYCRYEQIERSKADLRVRYDQCKSLATQLNHAVEKMKQVKGKVQQLRAERALQNIAEPDEDENALMKQLNELKASYHTWGKALGEHKVHIDHMHLAMKKSQDQLAKDFEQWYGIRQSQVKKLSGKEAVAESGDDGSGVVVGRMTRQRAVTLSSSSPLLVNHSRATTAMLPDECMSAKTRVPAVASLAEPQATFSPSSAAKHPSASFAEVFKVSSPPKARSLPLSSVSTTGASALPFRTTGNAAADQQLEKMYRAREEMRARLAHLRQHH